MLVNKPKTEQEWRELCKINFVDTYNMNPDYWEKLFYQLKEFEESMALSDVNNQIILRETTDTVHPITFPIGVSNKYAVVVTGQKYNEEISAHFEYISLDVNKIITSRDTKNHKCWSPRWNRCNTYSFSNIKKACIFDNIIAIVTTRNIYMGTSNKQQMYIELYEIKNHKIVQLYQNTTDQCPEHIAATKNVIFFGFNNGLYAMQYTNHWNAIKVLDSPITYLSITTQTSSYRIDYALNTSSLYCKIIKNDQKFTKDFFKDSKCFNTDLKTPFHTCSFKQSAGQLELIAFSKSEAVIHKKTILNKFNFRLDEDTVISSTSFANISIAHNTHNHIFVYHHQTGQRQYIIDLSEKYPFIKNCLPKTIYNSTTFSNNRFIIMFPDGMLVFMSPHQK